MLYDIKTKELLDSINLFPDYIENNDTVEDVMLRLSRVYDDSSITNNEVFQGFLFNNMTVDEFVDYLRERYPNLKFSEIITTVIHVSKY